MSSACYQTISYTEFDWQPPLTRLQPASFVCTMYAVLRTVSGTADGSHPENPPIKRFTIALVVAQELNRHKPDEQSVQGKQKYSLVDRHITFSRDGDRMVVRGALDDLLLELEGWIYQTDSSC